MLERYDEHVSASTNLRFNIEEQDGATFQALIYHCFGYLIIDGNEVPDNTGFWLDGQFLGNNQLTLYGTYFGHALSVQVDYLIGENPSDMLWFVHLSLDDDFYDVDLMMGDSAYVEFTY